MVVLVLMVRLEGLLVGGRLLAGVVEARLELVVVVGGGGQRGVSGGHGCGGGHCGRGRVVGRAHQREGVVLVRLMLVLVVGPQLSRRVLVGRCSSRRRRHVEEWIVVGVVGQRRLRWVVVLVVGLLDPVFHCHRPTRTVPVFAAAPVGDVFVVVAAHFVVPVAVEYESRSAALSGNESDC